MRYPPPQDVAINSVAIALGYRGDTDNIRTVMIFEERLVGCLLFKPIWEQYI